MKRAVAIPLLLAFGLGCCDGPSQAGPRTVELRGERDQTSEFFSFSAHQSATGEISGHIMSKSAPGYGFPFFITGRVTCITVIGNRASVGGIVDEQSSEKIPDAPRYHGWLYYVEDNSGHPGIPDPHSEYIWIFPEPVTYCPAPSADSATIDFTDGDLVVSTEE